MLYHTRRKCPVCGEVIAASATQCPVCETKSPPLRKLDSSRLFLLGWGAVVIGVGGYFLATREPTPIEPREYSLFDELVEDTTTPSDSVVVDTVVVTVPPVRRGDRRQTHLIIRRRTRKGMTAETVTVRQPELALDLHAIAGKDSAAVSRLLGEATPMIERAAGARERSYAYREGTVRVTFTNGRAERVVFLPSDDVPFSSDALLALGLPAVPPSRRTAGELRWDRVEGIAQVRAMARPEGGVQQIVIYITVPPS
ncbi:MAG TPA: hypothetical protein VFS05_07925 [Gemmatimonadaceae bacterium]|nr:hypothetical protein [Gemmatimonadaceae bacterium]